MPDPLHCCSCHANQYVLVLKAFGADSLNTLSLNGHIIGSAWSIPPTGGFNVFATDSTLCGDAGTPSHTVFTPTGQGLPTATTAVTNEGGASATFKADLINPGSNHVTFANHLQTYTFNIYQIQATTGGGFTWKILSQLINQDANFGDFHFTINADGSV